MARSHLFLACLNRSLDGAVVRLASAKISRSSSSSFVHHLFALGDHVFRPKISSRKGLNSEIVSSGVQGVECPTGYNRFFHSCRHSLNEVTRS
jgi:hypothetical protein